jgi:hypothetical protein
LDAINVYHAACYYGFPIDEIEDQLTQKAYYGIIRTYGQVPKVKFEKQFFCNSNLFFSNYFLNHIQPVV